jgi:hypothetical protein
VTKHLDAEIAFSRRHRTDDEPSVGAARDPVWQLVDADIGAAEACACRRINNASYDTTGGLRICAAWNYRESDQREKCEGTNKRVFRQENLL